jgi:hypothetical protein
MKLSELKNALDFVDDDTNCYLNLLDNKILILSDEDISTYEDNMREDLVNDWSIKVWDDVDFYYENIEHFKCLPTKYEIHEYKIMEDFAIKHQDLKLSEQMLYTLRGKGAFRRFKDFVFFNNIEEEWYEFRDLSLIQLLVDWCREHRISIEDDISK